MTQTPAFVLARHSETLDWYQVSYHRDWGSFTILKLDVSGELAFTLKLPDFEPTHLHYKGHEYCWFTIGRIDGGRFDSQDYVLYGDAEGNYWLRPRAMFEGTLEDGTLRFRPLLGIGTLP